ncbi:MAG: TonB-dependent receptor [Odoribacter splanchnicus]
MKKKWKDHFPYERKCQKILLRMKLVCLLMCLFLMQTYAGVNAQSVTIQKQNVSLEEVIWELKQKTHFNFMYSDKEIAHVKGLTLNEQDKDVTEVLGKCLEGTGLTCVKINNAIIIKREKEQQQAQPEIRKVKGRVTDEGGNPLPGVAVVIEGTTFGVATDIDGWFEIDCPVNGKVVLSFSFVGMKPHKVALENKKEVYVVLKEEVSNLDEVVVVGYGTAKAKDLTGSVSRLGEAEIKTAPMGASVQSMLQGRSPGVNVMISSASPTAPISVIIRGASSLTGDCQPLWVIDGIPQYVDGTSGDITNTLYNLNLNDVESIDILKDASGTAIYGSRAANGVVIVTTKRGKEGAKPTVEFSARYGIQSINNNKFGVLNADEYKRVSMAALRENIMTEGGLNYFVKKYVDENKFNSLVKSSQWSHAYLSDDLLKSVLKDDAYLSGNTDWKDLMTQNATTQQYDFSLRGGTKQSNYYLSFFYKDQKGVVKGSDSRLFGGRLNFESSVRDVLKVGLNLEASSRRANNKDQMLENILYMRPDLPAYNEDGSIYQVSQYIENPLITLKNRNRGYGRNISASAFLEWSILEGLKLRTTGTINYTESKSDQFDRVTYEGMQNSRILSNQENYVYVWENTLTWFKKFGKHDIQAVGGFSVEETQTKSLLAQGSNFPDDDILIDLGSAANKSYMSSSDVGNSLVSAFARVNYKFNNRYLLTATFRTDGSSKFGPDNRWGFFPSAAAGWLISEEDFMKGIQDYVPYLKLRFSVGKTGSQNLGNYDWRTLVASGDYDGNPGILPSRLGNDVLQWESQTQLDLGLDYGLWKERVRGSLGIYQKKVDNLLYDRPLPTSSSFTELKQNIGSVRNRGIEFDIKVDILNREELTWDVNFNIAKNVSKLMRINGVDKYFEGKGDNQYFRIEEGEKLGTFYGYKSANRLIKSMEEMVALQTIDPVTGKIVNYRDAQERPGDDLIIDLNGDGKINSDDRTYLGDANPDFFGGFGTSLYWKGFMVSAVFSYSYGAQRIYLQEKKAAGDLNSFNSLKTVLNSWTLGNKGDFPRVSYYGDGANDTFSDRYMHDASFLRLSALNITYRLPQQWLKNSIVQGIEFSAQATNLFTLTSYPGMDPQGNFNTANAAFYNMGLDNGRYPQARTFNFGVKFTFK